MNVDLVVSMQGTHLIGELHECDVAGALMNDAEALKKFVIAEVRRTGLTVLGNYFHQFEPCGVTGAVVLAESHVTLHTWPEAGYVALDVFVCNYTADNSDKAHRLYQSLVNCFKPKRVMHKALGRGNND